MVEKEPTTSDFLVSLGDVIASNKLVNVLRRKFQAQSHYDFFNRVFGMGLLLFLVGVIGLAAAFFLEEHKISLLDITNLLFIVGVAVVVWIILVIVGVVNEAANPIYVEGSLDRNIEILKTVTGFVILALLGYQLFWQSSTPLENLMLLILASILIGMVLLAIAWFFGGLSGLLHLRNLDENKG